jgi:hypothetical protein
MRRPLILASLVAILSCVVIAAQQSATPPAADAKAAPTFATLDALYKSLPIVKIPVLDETQALWLAAMPLSCLDHPQARPTTRGYLWEGTYKPIDGFQKSLAFYGCFDWHSAVNSTWALVKTVKMFPSLSTARLIRQKLDEHLGKTNIEGEVEYLKGAGQFELPYGYAWVLKVQGELLSWHDPDAEKWTANLAPLVTLVRDRLTQYFAEGDRPNRTGVHPNTALAMNLIWDYMDIAHDDGLKTAVAGAAKRYFEPDKNCKTSAEPGASDFHSPCLVEAEIMSRLLERGAFVTWLDTFLAPLQSPDFRPLTEPMDPTLITRPERIAAKSHLIGLGFMRAEAMNRIAAALPATDPRVPVLRRIAAMHGDMGFKSEAVAGYAASHYLGAFTIMYMLTDPAATGVNAR